MEWVVPRNSRKEVLVQPDTSDETSVDQRHAPSARNDYKPIESKYESTFIPQAVDCVSRKCIRQISFLYLGMDWMLLLLGQDSQTAMIEQ
nr:hypothetical protein [Tanacetum cinerariifolium]